MLWYGIIMGFVIMVDFLDIPNDVKALLLISSIFAAMIVAANKDDEVSETNEEDENF